MLPPIPYDPDEKIDPEQLWLLDLSAMLAAAMLVFAAVAGLAALVDQEPCRQLVAVGPAGGGVWAPCHPSPSR